MKVGDYVRSKEGYIAKITYIDDEDGGIDCDKPIRRVYETEYSNVYGGDLDKIIVETSPNLIDLIHNGDYVNRRLVDDVLYPAYKEDKDGNLKGIGSKLVFFGYHDYIPAPRIKTIVTRERFEKIEEDFYNGIMD